MDDMVGVFVCGDTEGNTYCDTDGDTGGDIDGDVDGLMNGDVDELAGRTIDGDALGDDIGSID